MQVLQTWLCCWGAKALNLRSVHQLFIGILIIQNKMYLRTFNMSFLQRHIEIQKVFSHFVSAVQRFYNVYYILYTAYLCKFPPKQWKSPLSINDACFVVVSTSHHPPPCDNQLLLRRYRSGAILKATSKVWFSKGSPLAPGSQKMWRGETRRVIVDFLKKWFPGKSG